MLHRKAGELSICGAVTEEQHYQHCSWCHQKVENKWNRIRNEVEGEFWYPQSEGRHRTVFDFDTNELGSVTYTEFASMVLDDHEKCEFILNHPREASENWDKENEDLYTVYVIRCGDGSLYVGQTGLDYIDRINQHRSNTTATSNFITKHGGFFEEVSIHHTRTRRSALELEKCIGSLLADLGHSVNEV